MIRVTNAEELKSVLEKLDRTGYVWISGSKPMDLYEGLCDSLKYNDIAIERKIGYDPDKRTPTYTLTWRELKQVEDFLREVE